MCSWAGRCRRGPGGRARDRPALDLPRRFGRATIRVVAPGRSWGPAGAGGSIAVESKCSMARAPQLNAPLRKRSFEQNPWSIAHSVVFVCERM